MKRLREIEREGEITLGRKQVLSNKAADALLSHQRRELYPTWELDTNQENLESHPDDEPDEAGTEQVEAEQPTAEAEATTTEPIKTDEVNPATDSENANAKRSNSKAQ